MHLIKATATRVGTDKKRAGPSVRGPTRFVFGDQYD